MPLTPNRRRGLVQVHIAAFLVGFPGLFSKWLDLDPGMITLSRTAIGSVTLLLFLVCMRTSLRIHSRRDAAMLILSGIGLAANWLAFFQSIKVSTVAVGLLAFSTFPLFVTFLEPLFYRERLRWFDIVTALVVMTGLSFVAPIFDFGNRFTQGVLWGIGCALACAMVSLLSRSIVQKYPPITVTFYQQAFGALFTLPALATFHGHISVHTAALLLLLGVVFTALAGTLVTASLQHIRAQLASVVVALEPVYGIIFAIFLLHEIPSPRTVLGGTLICSAVFWASYQHATMSARRRDVDEGIPGESENG
jgi:drug/metabolite transporter (DMT)-like permease